ncbi:hypothetical protein I6J27_07185 [Corynebacterium striatum]|nr:hypothetical protein I6J27_07185 [Corynebacterium striatum]
MSILYGTTLDAGQTLAQCQGGLASLVVVDDCRFVVVGTGNPRSWYRVSG